MISSLQREPYPYPILGLFSSSFVSVLHLRIGGKLTVSMADAGEVRVRVPVGNSVTIRVRIRDRVRIWVINYHS